MGHDYERELKGVLTGEQRAVDKMTKTGGNDIVLAYRQPTREPFQVVRAAGSLGDGDLVVMRNGFAFLVEVKAANRDTVHFSESSGKLQEQAEALTESACKAGTLALYAFRLKGHRKKDPWRLFSLPTGDLGRKFQMLADRVPELPTTGSDTYVLRWEEGRPLHAFLEHFYWVFEDGLAEEPMAATN